MMRVTGGASEFQHVEALLATPVTLPEPTLLGEGPLQRSIGTRKHGTVP
jgi:hypothetical protein